MIKEKIKYILMVVILMASQGIMADTVTQAYIDQWANNNGIVGAGFAINDYDYVYGNSNLSLKQAVTPQTEFGMGSITKTFISVALLKLEAAGKLNIHDPVTRYLPQYPKLSKVTLQSLMQMTAGFNDIKSANSLNTLQAVNVAYAHYDSKDSGVWNYSNVSYQLLGMVIEKVTGQTLAEEIALLITNPLHLSHIYFPTTAQAALLPEYQDNQVKTSDFQAIGAEGGLVSNAQDLEVFIRHLFVTKDVLPAKQYAELTTFVNTPQQYYAFTKTEAPQFGLGVFKWNIPPYGKVLTYPGVLGAGFTSTYTVIGANVIIAQSNTYNHNDFTLLWPHRAFTRGLIKMLNK